MKPRRQMERRSEGGREGGGGAVSQIQSDITVLRLSPAGSAGGN